MVFDRATKLAGFNEQKGYVLLVENEVIAYIPGKGAISITLDSSNLMALLKHTVYQVDDMLRYYMDRLEQEAAKLEKRLDEKINQAQSGVFDNIHLAEMDFDALRQDIRVINEQLDETYRYLDWIGDLYEAITKVQMRIERAWEAIERIQYRV